MKTFIVLTTIFLYGLVRPDNWHSISNLTGSASNKDIGRRQKRYLAFQKGSTFTVQGNIAKSIILGTPRGLNEIAEYTLMYDLPTDFDLLKIKETTRKTTTTSARPPLLYHLPYERISAGYGHRDRPVSYRKYSKCARWNLYEYRGKLSQMCLKRTKRVLDFHSLSTSERMLYDILEKWSRMHGFVPRYCFMRTLCEARHILFPYGYSLLHDLIQILLSYTKKWAVHHGTFGHSLKHGHSMDECAELYGPHCRVSWLGFVTAAVHGSRADFVR